LETKPYVLDGKVTCWIDDFETHIGSLLPSSNFDSDLATFSNTDEGKSAKQGGILGYIDGELKFSGIMSLAVGETNQAAEDMQETLDPWIEYIQEIKDTSLIGFNNPIYSS